MSARSRAEAVLALVYLIVLPFVVVAAIVVQVLVLDAAASPSVPYWPYLLNASVAAPLVGAFLFIVVRVTVERRVANASLARWPARLAPIVLCAMVPTAAGLWLVLARGHTGLNGLIVLPALAAWGAAAGEVLAHGWLARGRDDGTLLRRAFLGASAATLSLVVAARVLRSPERELEMARERCAAAYARDRTAADSAMTAQWMPVIDHGLDSRTCSELPRATQRPARNTPRRP